MSEKPTRKELEKQLQKLKQRQEELKQNEKRYRSVIDTVEEGIILQSESGEILTWNKAAEKMFDLSPEKAVGKLSTDRDWPTIHEDGSKFAAGDHPSMITLKTGKPLKNVIMGVKQENDETRWISINTNPIFEQGSDLPKAVAISFSDITENRKTEEKLRSNEKKYKNLFNFTNDGICLHEMIYADGEAIDYRIIDINPKYEKFTGIKKEDALGKTGALLYQTEKAPYLDLYARVARTGEPVSFETYFEPMGKYFLISVFSPEQHQFATVFQDITKRKRYEARIQKSQKMESIGNLAGGIAHDFNNLLFPILGMSELLLEDLPKGSIEYENVEEIFKAGKRGRDLVQQILAFSRQSEQQIRPTRIQNVLREVLKLSRSSIPSDIDIAQEIQPDCGMVMADPTHIHQLAMNLITNAYHAVEQSGGKISIHLKETVVKAEEISGAAIHPGRYVVFQVSDNGVGIGPEIVDKIFDPYFTTKGKGKGTGLGLAVVYGIIQEYGGDILVDSACGRGSTFSVFIPQIDDHAANESEMAQEPFQTGSEHILLVDDEWAVANLEKKILERLGYRVTEHTSSVDAVEAFRSNPDAFDIIITDMTMPHMTGARLAQEILSIKTGTPVLLCTGFSERIDKDKAAALGIHGFLMKPVGISDFARMVRQVLDEPN